jgi:glycerol-3-phosphate acyltransferase PlsY
MVGGSILLLVGAYVLGALPFAVALAVANGVDPSEGDLHIALWYKVGPASAALAAVVDIAKGAFPVLIGYGFSLPVGVVALAGVVATIGQMWPPLRGHGEKGNTTGMGALVVLLLAYGAYGGLLCIGFFAVGAAVRYGELRSLTDVRGTAPGMGLFVLPLCMLLGFASAPFFTWLSNEPAGLTTGLLLLFVGIVVRRLTAGLDRDISVGAKLGPVLLRRFLFDQSLVTHDL